MTTQAEWYDEPMLTFRGKPSESEAIFQNVLLLRALFDCPIGGQETIRYDADCPSYDVGSFSICPPNTDLPEDKWLVLAWTYFSGSYDEPPDAWETELGHFDTFLDAVKCVWRAESEQGLEAKLENLYYTPIDTVHAY